MPLILFCFSGLVRFFSIGHYWVMSNEIRYVEVREITDWKRVNSLINGGGWDLLKVATPKREGLDGIFEEQIVYVVGLRPEAQ